MNLRLNYILQIGYLLISHLTTINAFQCFKSGCLFGFKDQPSWNSGNERQDNENSIAGNG